MTDEDAQKAIADLRAQLAEANEHADERVKKANDDARRIVKELERRLAEQTERAEKAERQLRAHQKESDLLKRERDEAQAALLEIRQISSQWPLEATMLALYRISDKALAASTAGDDELVFKRSEPGPIVGARIVSRSTRPPMVVDDGTAGVRWAAMEQVCEAAKHVVAHGLYHRHELREALDALATLEKEE